MYLWSIESSWDRNCARWQDAKTLCLVPKKKNVTPEKVSGTTYLLHIPYLGCAQWGLLTMKSCPFQYRSLWSASSWENIGQLLLPRNKMLLKRTLFWSGNGRFDKIFEAVQRGDEKPPVDLRYLSRSQFARDKTHETVTEVLSFLETIYTSVAENLPDVRDDTFDGEPDHETSVVDDPYSLHIGLYEDNAQKVAKEKVTKPKKHQRGVQVCPGRTCRRRVWGAVAPKWHDERILGTVLHTKSFCQSLLPYILESSSPKVISFTGVFAKMSKEMFRSQHQHIQKIQDSFQSFWPSRYHSFIIWLVHGWFGLVCVRMFQRSTCRCGRHITLSWSSADWAAIAQCTECVKHKAMIAMLAHLRARRVQQQMLYAHLQSQFRDRVVYWHSPGRAPCAGLGNCFDPRWKWTKASFQAPRSSIVRAKAFESFNRPRLHVAGVICHGRHVALYLSKPDVAKDSNTSCEILAHTLHELAEQGVDLSACRFPCKPTTHPGK